MKKYLLFFFIIGSSFFVFFSYVMVISKSLGSQPKIQQTDTEKILKKQSDNIDRLNQDYRQIIEQSKRQTEDVSRKLNNTSFSRDLDQTLKDNRRQMEENRRQMEQLRRDLKRQ